MVCNWVEMKQSKSKTQFFSNIVSENRKIILFACCLLILIGPRLPHITGPIDDPHSWRQCDTANYAFAFYHDGIDLLRPSVCWMGDYKTVILEFPFPEMLMAMVYSVFGSGLFIARIITLIFFAGSAIYLYLIVKSLFFDRIALLATAIYLILPLSLFYSRAIHIDFYAVFFAHAMTYYLIRGYEEPSIRYAIVGMIAGCMAFLTKAPYAFYLVLPISVLVIIRYKPRYALVLVAAVGVPVLVFSLWRLHVNAVNEAAPDWFFIPGYMKFVNMEGWYYGPLNMRWNPHVWKTILERFQNEVGNQVGIWLFVIGLITSLVRRRYYGFKSVWFAWMWLGGVFSYLAIFLNLNYVHNYYQIPFLAIVSLFMAISLDTIYEISRRYILRFAWVPVFSIYFVLGYYCVSYAEAKYFGHDSIRIEAGDIIQRVTPENSIIIAAVDMPGTDCRDPRLLYRAKRNGWSVYERHLSRELITALKTQGAQYLAVVTKMRDKAKEICGQEVDIYALRKRPWRVVICKL